MGGDGILFDFKIDKSAVQRELGSMRDDIKGFSERIKSDTAISLSMKVGELKSQMDEARRMLATAKKSGDFDLQVKINADMSIMQQQLTQAQRELRNFTRTGEKDVSVLGKNFASVGGAFEGFINKTAGLAAISYSLQQVGGGALTLAGNLEQAQISFTTMLGSSEKANKLLMDLTDFAKKTPFELVGIRQNAKQLLAMGIEADNLIPTMKALGDVSAGLSVPMDRLALAYGQVMAKGKLQGGELKQFTEAGVPLLQELADMLGKTKGEIGELITDGAISSELVAQAFQRMTSEGGRFANLMDAQSKTMQGSRSNLKDSLNSLGETAGMVFVPMITKIIQAVNNVIGPIVAWIQQNKAVSTVIFTVIGAIGGLITILGTLGVILPAIKAGMLALGMSMSAIFGPATLAIAVVSAMYVAYKNNFMGIQNVVTNRVNNLQIMFRMVQIMFSRLTSIVAPFLKGFHTITKNTVGEVVRAFGGLNGIGDKVRTAMRIALGVATLGMSELVRFVYNKLAQLDFVVSARRQAIAGISAQETALGLKNNPNVAGYNPNLSGLKNINAKNIKAVGSSTAPIDFGPIDLPAGGGGGGGGGGKSEAQQKAEEEQKEREKMLKDEQKLLEDARKQASDSAIKAYDKINERIDESKENMKKYGEEVKKVGEKFIDMQKDATKSLQDITASLLGLEGDKMKSLMDRYIDGTAKIAEIQKKLDYEGGKMDRQDRVALEEELKKLKEEQALIQGQTTAEQRKQAEETAKLSESQKILKKYEEDKLILLEKQRIIQDMQKSTFDESGRKIVSGISDFKLGDDLTATYTDAEGKIVKINDIKNAQYLQEQLQKQTALQEELVAIQAKEVAEKESQDRLIKQKISLENDYKNAFNESIASQKGAVKSLFDDWASGASKTRGSVESLIVSMENALRKQQQLSSSGGAGFANGGFTGAGAKYDVAGVVHKGEYVVPQWMVNKYSGVVGELENIRSKGFANGGFTDNRTTNKNFSPTVYANQSVDMDRLVDYFRWKV